MMFFALIRDVFLLLLLIITNDHFLYLKGAILPRIYAHHVVTTCPRRQETATSWLLYVQSVFGEGGDRLVRDIFHAGLKEHVRLLLRYRCTRYRPIWFVAYIVNQLEQETHAIVPFIAAGSRKRFHTTYTHFLCPGPLPRTHKLV